MLLSAGWALQASAAGDAAVAGNLRVLVRDDAGGGDSDDEGAAAEANMRVLRKRPNAALAVVTSAVAPQPAQPSSSSSSSYAATAAVAPPALPGLSAALFRPVQLGQRPPVAQLTGMQLRALPTGFGSSGPGPRVEVTVGAAAGITTSAGGDSKSSSKGDKKKEKKEKKSKRRETE
jgi:hypothetical protein